MTARPFTSVLMANRGEIAVRVIRDTKARDMTAIAVYSDADADALHVREADMAVRIGPAAASESYLKIDAILEAARKTGAEAIHPGYGFLSENADFARAVIDAGLVWIGPPPEAIDAMGDKARAKALMIKAGVPTVPGWQGEDQSDAHLQAEADKIGYPLLIKAVAGGGGRGMRIVRSSQDFAEALVSARREAASAFGDDAVLLEKFVERGRHVEIQIFADTHGQTIHLAERDCSAQRRRQKVIEEAPSPSVDADLRERMGADAVAAARAVNYVGAGTVEFLLDEDGSYYFLEMNTRLQVEHPVTEEITGQNLVKWQFNVAAGAPLPLTQDQVVLEGWAIEARLYAEDPLNGFAPQTGEVLSFCRFARGSARTDEGLESGDLIGADYDPMVAKIIGWGHSREAAIRSLIQRLREDPLLGVTTNRDFLLRLLQSDAFRQGAITTADLDRWAETSEGPFAPPELDPRAIGLAVAQRVSAPNVVRSASAREFDLALIVNGTPVTVRVLQQADDDVTMILNDLSHTIRRFKTVPYDVVQTFGFDGVDLKAITETEQGKTYIALDDQISVIEEASPWGGDDASDPSKIVAPVSGAVVAVNVKPGDAVKAGDVLAVMEAMKMEMRLSAEADGVVTEVQAQAGTQAANGAVLITLELQTQDETHG